MRTMAICGVLVAHGVSAFISNHLSPSWNAFTGWLGFVGVEMFFALSGFLVGGIIAKSLTNFDKYTAIKHFWIMRWYRTIPNYAFYLLIHIFFLANTTTLFSTIKQHAHYLFFLQSFAWSHPQFFPESWSLAIEEWFYLLTPLSIWLLTKLKFSTQKSLIITIATLIIIPIALRTGIAFLRPDLGIEFHRKVVVLRLDAIMYGVIAAYMHHKHHAIFKRNSAYSFLTGITLLSTVLLYQFSGFANDLNKDIPFKTIALSLTPFACALLIPFLFQQKASPSKVSGNVIYFFAKISYSLYLCNLIALEIIQRHIIKSNATSLQISIFAFFAFLLLCSLIATFTYKYVEKPFLNYRNKKYAHQ